MRNLVAALALALASVSQAQVVRSETPQTMLEGKKFSVVIERSGTQWKARCEFGCAWAGATLSFSCPENCDAVLDANGLITTLARRDAKPAFSFVLSESEGKIYADPNAGTEWRQLGWSCGKKDPCTARVNEFGVSRVGMSFGR